MLFRYSLGKIEDDTKDNTKMTRNMDMESSHGLMEE